MKKTTTYLLLVLSVVFWGVSFIFTKQLFLTEEHMTVTLLITLRLAIATAVMLPVMLLGGRLQPIQRRDMGWFLLLALCEPFIYHLCETSGVQLVSASLASVIIATIPLFVPFGMWIAYRQRIGLPLIAGVLMSLGGVALMLFSGDGGAEFSAAGLAFLAGAVVVAVVYTLLLVKIVGRYEPLVITTWQNLIGLAYFLPLALLHDGSRLGALSWSPQMLGLLLVLGICCSTLAYAFYNRGVAALGASEACIFNNAIPIFSLIAAVALGQETFSWVKAVGMTIVIAGVAISQNPSPRGGREKD